MIAREALSVLDALARALPRATIFPEVSQCRAFAEAASTPETVAPPISRDVVEAIRSELRLACERGHVADIPLKTLRDAPLVLWNGEYPAAEFPGLLDRFLRETGTRARWLGALIEGWLRDFDTQQRGFAETGRVLASRVAAADHPRLFAWKQAEREFALFDAASSPRRLAQALLHAPEPTAELLRRSGMSDPIRAASGFFRASVAALVDLLPAALRDAGADSAWARAAELLQVDQVTHDRHGQLQHRSVLRFAEFSGSIARASLSPWLEGASTTLSSDPVKRFLVATLGDPRLAPAKWESAGEKAKALVCQWLAKDTLDAFFALISQRSDDKQWRYRQKFWRACLSKRKDAEVWVVLDPALQSWARTLPALKGAFGVMNGAGVRGQAVLLFRIGQTVLSEWSNVGPLRAWSRNNRDCPPLYAPQYATDDLRGSCLEFPDAPPGGRGLRHDSPERYLWQGRAAALLGQREGLWLNRFDYA